MTNHHTQRVFESKRVEGFCQERVHPRFKTFIAVVAGRERHDRHTVQVFVLADSNETRGREAVQLGHLHVHQDEVEPAVVQCRQHFPTVLGDRYAMPLLSQESDGELLMEQTVLREQNAQTPDP